MKLKLDVKNPDNYHYKPPETCMIKGCINFAVWWIDDNSEFGVCDNCFNKLIIDDLKKDLEKLKPKEEIKQ